MEYTKLQDLRDIYPTGEENVNTAFSIPDPPPITIDQAYETTSPTSVQFRGKYPENYLNFAKRELNNIKRAPFLKADGSPLDFQFIVNFAQPDGTADLWTSPTFADKLEQAARDDNPYFTLDRVPVVVLPYVQLANYYTGFGCGESYAQVEITKTIGLPNDDTVVKEEMLRHINWMISSLEELRPIPEFGEWLLNITATLGREFSQCIKEEAVGDSLNGFNSGSFPIVDPNGVLDFNFDNSFFDGINRLTDPRSNQDGPFGNRFEGLTNSGSLREDGPISDGESREDTRNNQDGPFGDRGDDNTDVREEGSTFDGTRSGEEDSVPRPTSSTVTIRNWTDPTPIETRSPSGYTGGTFYPFSTAGKFIGETRTFIRTRATYVWTGTSWTPV